MSAPRKGTRKFQIQLEAVYIEELRGVAEAEGEPSANALAAKLIREGLKEKLSPTPKNSPDQTAQSLEIDLRSLLMEAHRTNLEANRTIAELTRTITALSEERKNAPAEPAATVAPSASTVTPPQRGRARVITGLRQDSPV